jgi:hypothetical protein
MDSVTRYNSAPNYIYWEDKASWTATGYVARSKDSLRI